MSTEWWIIYGFGAFLGILAIGLVLVGGPFEGPDYE